MAASMYEAARKDVVENARLEYCGGMTVGSILYVEKPFTIVLML